MRWANRFFDSRVRFYRVVMRYIRSKFKNRVYQYVATSVPAIDFFVYDVTINGNCHSFFASSIIQSCFSVTWLDDYQHAGTLGSSLYWSSESNNEIVWFLIVVNRFREVSWHICFWREVKMSALTVLNVGSQFNLLSHFSHLVRTINVPLWCYGCDTCKSNVVTQFRDSPTINN